MTRTTKTTKTTKTRKAEAEVKEPSRKPETSREAMLTLFRKHVEAKVRAAEQSHNKSRENFLGRFNDPAWGANDAIGWTGGAVIVAEFNYRAWVIDRVVYTLLGGPDHHEDYLRWVAEWECNGEYHWEKGIIP